MPPPAPPASNPVIEDETEHHPRGITQWRGAKKSQRPALWIGMSLTYGGNQDMAPSILAILLVFFFLMFMGVIRCSHGRIEEPEL